MFNTNTLTFKTDCPKCGGKNKIKTKVNLSLKGYSGAKCYKCGFKLPGGSLKEKASRRTFTVSSDEDDREVQVAA